MRCANLKRAKNVSQVATAYKLYLNRSTTGDFDIIIEHAGTGRKVTVQKTSAAETINTLSLTFVSFAFTDFGYFLNSDSDFIITVVKTTATTGPETLEELYLLRDEDDVDVFADGVLIKFEQYVSNADVIGIPGGLTTQTISAC